MHAYCGHVRACACLLRAWAKRRRGECTCGTIYMGRGVGTMEAVAAALSAATLRRASVVDQGLAWWEWRGSTVMEAQRKGGAGGGWGARGRHSLLQLGVEAAEAAVVARREVGR